MLCARHVEAEKQPGTEAGLNVATEDQHLQDFLSNRDSATRGQGPGRELSQHPLHFVVQYCSQNHSAPAGQPSVEACWRVITPPSRGTQQGSEEPQWVPAWLCPVTGQTTASSSCPPPRAGRPAKRLRHRGGQQCRGEVQAGQTTQRLARQGQGSGQSAASPQHGRRSPPSENASRPAPHPLPRACATPPSALGSGQGQAARCRGALTGRK